MNYVPIIHLNEVDSTNTFSKKLIEEYDFKKGFVISDIQTRGKGRYGKHWVSKIGNIYLSFFFQQHNINFKKFYLIFPVLIKKFIEKYTDSKALIKWPNDIIINGKKICGILTEYILFNKKKFIVVGIGININSSPKVKKYPTIYLKKIVKKNFSLNDIIDDLLILLSKVNLKRINYKSFIKKWNSSMYLMNKEIKFLSQKIIHNGILKGIDTDAKLILLNNKRKFKFSTGSIL